MTRKPLRASRKADAPCSSSTKHRATSRADAIQPDRADRVRLTRKIIIRAALHLIDQNGSEALNMRELGAILGASPMSVYRHFENKAELLSAVVDHVIEGLMPKPSKASWQAQARTLALRVRSTMLAHPNLTDFMGRELHRSAISLRVNAEVIERMSVAGVPPSLLSETYWALASYANGYALLEVQSRKHRKPANSRKRRDERVRKITELLKSVDQISDVFLPNVATVLSSPLDEEQFLFGLNCLIEGLENKVRAYKGA